MDKAKKNTVIHAAADRMAANYKSSQIPMYGDALRMPNRNAVIEIIRDCQKLFFPVYYGNRDLTAMIRQGGSFAEVFACSAVKLLPVTVEAASDCTVMLLDYVKLSSLSSYPFYPQFVSNLLTVVSDNALMLNRKVEIISKRTTKEKIMAYLSHEAKKAGSDTFTVPLDRRSMADYLGVERSAMSARLSELVKEGRIKVDKNTFTVLKCHCGLDKDQ